MAYNFNQLNVKEKIGVGTETPTEALEVKGNIKLNSGVPIGEFSSDGTLATASHQSVPTTQTVKTYINTQIETVNAAALATFATKGGSSTQDFQVNNLTAQGNLQVTGTMTANKFIGDGSSLTGLTGVTQWTNGAAGNISYSGGKVGIGISTPEFVLDVAERIRVRQGDNASAGIWFHQTIPATDRAFVGMASDNQVGFFGSTGGWGLVMDTSSNEVSYAGNVSFGSRTRQMINLWAKEYGIGVQALTTYFRSFANFSWFSGGVHNDATNNPGGGVKLMSLNGAGDLCLSARTNPTGNPGGSMCRALVDGGNKLIVNFGGDYASGVEIFNGRFISSREYKENIADLSTQEATIALQDLNPVKFSYKTDRSENLHLGFIAEDVPDLLAADDKRSIGPLDVVAVLTKVVQEQQSTIASLIDRLNVLEAKQA